MEKDWSLCSLDVHANNFDTLEKDEINSDEGHWGMRRLWKGVEDEKGPDKWNKELSPSSHAVCLLVSEGS